MVPNLHANMQRIKYVYELQEICMKSLHTIIMCDKMQKDALYVHQ